MSEAATDSAEPEVVAAVDAPARSDSVFAGDADPNPEPPPAFEPEPLSGKLVEVRYTGPIDEVEVVLPNGARARVKQGGYLKTTKEHADALTLSEDWKAKGGSA